MPVSGRSTRSKPFQSALETNRVTCGYEQSCTEGDVPVLNVVAVAAAVALAAIFIYASVAKLRARDATAEDFRSLGLPEPARWAILVPVLELAVASLLVVLPGWGGVAAFGLLAAFTANLALVLRSGRVAHCACFGGASTKPVSGRHLARNVALLALALLAATVDGPIWAQ